MATTMTQKTAHGFVKKHLSIFEKAQNLNVYRVEGDEPNTLVVSSGSQPNKAYRVWHHGVFVLRCNCPTQHGRCCHMVAAGDFLYKEAREAQGDHSW